MANPNTDSPHRTIDGCSGNLVTESRFAVTTNDTDKHTTVTIGSLSVDGFQMPNGNCQMSPAQAMESVGKSPRNAGQFLESKGIKALQGAGYTPDAIEVESSARTRDSKSTLLALGETYAEPNLLGIKVNTCGSRSLTLVANLGYYRKSRTRCIIYMENHPCPGTAAVESDKVISFPLKEVMSTERCLSKSL
jgi:hypothetical protein